MIIIPIKENESIDRALKKFKKKFERTGVIRALRERKQFTKPSVKRRTAVLKAIYKDGLNNSESI
jgi:small subunit ribosomal protein S21